MEPRITFKETRKGYLDGLMKLAQHIATGTISNTLQELIKIRASFINSCAPCIDMHIKDAMQNGETIQRITGLNAWEEAPYYTPAERAVLALTDSLTKHCKASDETYANLQEHFTKEEIADITLLIGVINTFNRINAVFRPTPGLYEPAKNKFEQAV
ncbi:AhpD family alkylhydroperoxidase [Chitinophaga skermanii]|uniref:AhpD family alkylhydroperoxidase n=1 Tax=Chitinophaga skermanii TaxID=331697 RepID=A0A327QXV5_9BACT|nr:carboxymuconolactone decarboxylase family protein [Chitinophaga skermanii]RAJ06477.1 AhpD family alkylhydroperoxidase [Chitinophaga skermanii]